MKNFSVILFVLFTVNTIGQIKGTITDTQKKPIATASVYLDKTITGTTSNEHGNYILNITKTGNYTIVFQFLGYKTLQKEITITSFPFVLNVTLEEEKVVLDEISVSTKENPANSIIRNAIANKEKNTNKLGKYTAKFYSRGLYKIKNAPEKILGQSLGDFGGGLDSTRSGIVYLSETISEIVYQKKPKQFKEKIIASKVSGSDNGISFNRAQDAYINFYDNKINLGGGGLISPIATNAFGYYKYKLEGSFYDKNELLINKIALLPKRKNDPVFKGFIYIVEDSWAIYGTHVSVRGSQIGFPPVEILNLKQNYNSTEDDTWVLISQAIDFKFNFFGFHIDGTFSSGYSNYNFTPVYTDETFSNEVLTFAKEATKKDTVYWNQLRPVPLTKEEMGDYKIKDKLKEVRKSKKYLDSLDLKRNQFNWLSPVLGYTYRNSYKKWSVTFNSPIDEINFNTVKGFNSSMGLSYFKRQNDLGKWWNIGMNVNYGLSEKKWRPTLFFSKKWNNISRPRLRISGGISTPQFNNREPISKLENQLYSLFAKRNYLKIYEKTFARAFYSEEVTNGLRLRTSLEFADRKPLFNTSNYSYVSKDFDYTSNNPIDGTNFNTPFNPHKIWTLNIGANIVFNQKYISYPNQKFNLDDDTYPSLYVGYTKRFGANNNALNSDVFITRLQQDISLNTFGDFNYNIRSGIFLKKKDIAFMDYLHPNGNQTQIGPGNTNSFGLLAYYEFSTNDKYAEMHVAHNFKGFLLHKIPLINELNFHLVTGAKALFTAERKPYTEYSVGLDNIGWGKWRFLRIDYVRSRYNNQTRTGFLFGISLFD